MVILHDDYASNQLQPIELSDAIQKFVPLEYLASLLYFILCFESDAPLWFNFLTLPLLVYNVSCVRAGEHKLYFMTRGECGAKHKQLQKQYYAKTGAYGVLFLMALVMAILRGLTVVGI